VTKKNRNISGRMSPFRLVTFSLVSTILLLAGLEIVARVFEPSAAPPRTLPLPAPTANHMARESFQRQAARERRKLFGKKGSAPIPLASDPEVGWMLPKTIHENPAGVDMRVNRWGLRGGDVLPLRRGEVRLMSLGDSSIFGFGVEEEQIFTSLAAKALEKKWHRPVSSVIGAVPGHDTNQSLVILRRYGPEIRPSWVVVGNLWSDVYRQDRSGAVIEEDEVLRPPLNRTLAHLAIYRTLRRWLDPWLARRTIRFLDAPSDVGRMDGGPGPRVRLARYKANLEAMSGIARRLGARVAFVILAAPMDLEDAPVPDTIAYYREAMRMVAEEQDAPLIDGPRLFREANATLGYFIDQVHPSEYGHALLGAALGRALEAAGPPPEGKSTYYPPRPLADEPAPNTSQGPSP